MFKTIQSKTIKAILMLSLAVNGIAAIENLAIYGATKSGLVSGQFKPPAVAFGGFDAQQHQQLAMLGGAIDEDMLKPLPEKPAKVAAAKVAPVPQEKPTVPVR